jgi:hypothetical protein
MAAKELSARLSKRLANYKLSDKLIQGIARRIEIPGFQIGKFHPCIYGICVDYFWEKGFPDLGKLTPARGIRKFDVFPYGIIDWDRFLVRVAYEVDELEGKVRS